jgi:hypothetical protein
MEPALDGWFGGLADRVIGRAMESLGTDVETKVSAEDLVTSGDDAELEAVVRRFVVELAQLSWQTWNLSLGVDVAFDLHDPAVTAALEGAGLRIKGINETTLQAVRDALQFGSEQGWGIDRIVRGDPKADPPVRGLRDIVEATYKGRAQSIARTEMGIAAQTCAAHRFAAAGVPNVLVLDNGFDDSAPGCVVLGNGGVGTIVPLSWAIAHPLGHPRCFSGETPVLASGVVRSYARHYEGDVLIVTTAAGCNLTVTANHPILTPSGWVAAGDLHEGSDVFRVPRERYREMMTTIGNDAEDCRESPIAEKAQAVNLTGLEAVRMAITDFHGDGTDGDVCIVRTDCQLEDGTVPQQPQLISQSRLGGVDLALCPLNPRRDALAVLDGMPDPPSRLVGSVSPVGVLFAGKAVDLQASAQRDAPLAKAGPDYQIANPHAMTDTPSGLAGFVSLDRVVSIKHDTFSGHVYNLETTTGWYLADSIVTHNCVRAFAPSFADDGPVAHDLLSQWQSAGGD